MVYRLRYLVIMLHNLIKPINRVDIQFVLNELTSKTEHLTPIEKIELNFYLQEYKHLNSNDFNKEGYKPMIMIFLNNGLRYLIQNC
jgi:hypothetical protein